MPAYGRARSVMPPPPRGSHLGHPKKTLPLFSRKKHYVVDLHGSFFSMRKKHRDKKLRRRWTHRGTVQAVPQGNGLVVPPDQSPTHIEGKLGSGLAVAIRRPVDSVVGTKGPRLAGQWLALPIAAADRCPGENGIAAVGRKGERMDAFDHATLADGPADDDRVAVAQLRSGVETIPRLSVRGGGRRG